MIPSKEKLLSNLKLLQIGNVQQLEKFFTRTIVKIKVSLKVIHVTLLVLDLSLMLMDFVQDILGLFLLAGRVPYPKGVQVTTLLI